ncbi:MAG TPA: hypothetical protein VFE78_13455 [Gemmataceae bacterium]|jgi:hypothetical protein|nr:hypothetical protein [Gemmataceae bacterium]
MPTPAPNPRQALVPLLGFGLLAAVAAASLWLADLPSLLRARAETGRAFPDRNTDPAATTFLVSDLRRFPCVVERNQQVRVDRINTAVDYYGPGVDAPGGAAGPLDSWEKLDHWSIGHGRRYDPFFGFDN